MPYLRKARNTIADTKRLHILEGLASEQTSFLYFLYYGYCSYARVCSTVFEQEKNIDKLLLIHMYCIEVFIVSTILKITFKALIQ